MKLNDLMQKSLEETLKGADVVKVTPISDDYGIVKKIIIEYVPVEENKKARF
ncbi:hypothetical protein [Clostridium weizhouense]|uniref:Uncharacterized protein n=1 Tax=Clostridium weizhouense TaxID=2859781 RepID=A0ABS7ALR4_9CLOT|nr:hypothetical protein [Clostridium weizhouense]MBW6409018.1 hypothetical protein [Clostridium weizhouense]